MKEDDNMLFIPEDIEIYGVKEPNLQESQKAKNLYNKLNLKGMMTFKGMYLAIGDEIQALNINAINSFDNLALKIERLRKYRKKLGKWQRSK